LWLGCALLLLGSHTLLLGGTLLLLRGCALGFDGTLLLLWGCALRFDGALLLLRSYGSVGFDTTLLLLRSHRAVGFRTTLLLGFGATLRLGGTVRFNAALLLGSDAGAVLRAGGALLLGLDVVLLDGDAALLLLADGCRSFRDVRSAGGDACGTGEGSLCRATVVVVVELRAVL
jgi:hypothetical protein